ncbi:MAG: decaprenyl-phosphate phosphoribosyltransferase, partial [Phycisphaerae bacterium]
MPYLQLLRPSQWIKNVFVFAGLIFGRKLTDPTSIGITLLGFACLCLLSSLVYIVNDIQDREEDKLHPRKCRRPIASGQVGVSVAATLVAALLLVGLSGSWLLDRGFGIVATAYLVLQTLYTYGFKHAVILDVIAIGLGFVLRAVSGAVLLHVDISPWLVLCTFTLCLFMGFGKRRCELNALAVSRGTGAAGHRRTLSIYTPDLLNHMTTLTAGIAIVSFMLYTIDDRTIAQFGSRDLGLFGSKCLLSTLPIVVYAVFRFAVLVEHGEVDGPTDVVFRDRPFQVAILLWVVAALLIVYRTEQLHGLFGGALR